MTSQAVQPFRQSGRAALTLLIVSAIIVFCAASAFPAGASEPSVKMVRQIGIMEKILDKLLLDSKFFLVHGGSYTRGLYIAEFGVLFSFDASLTDDSRYYNEIFKNMGPNFEVKTDEDGNQVIVLKDKNKDKKKGKSGSSSEEEGEEGSEGEESGLSGEELSQRTYEEGKEELIQCLLDYGETMSSVQDAQWLGIAAFLDRVEFLKESGPSRLFIKAKMADLRDFGAGRISDSDMRSRIEIDEY